MKKKSEQRENPSKPQRWLFVTPVQGVGFSDRVFDEYALLRVTLIHRDKLLRATKRFPVRKHHSKWFTVNPERDSGFEKATVYALHWVSGDREELRQKCLQTTSEELAIFSIFRMAHKRRHVPIVGLAGEHPQASTSHAFLHAAERTSQRFSGLIKAQIDIPLTKTAPKSIGFRLLSKLLKVLRDKSNTKAAWRSELYRVAVLIGRSYNSSDVATAFLFQMIALETLLTKQGDKYSSDLPQRIESILGWVGLWTTAKYGERLREVYRKRCAVVHAGRIDDITIEDLLFVDDIMINILWNIVSHPKIFRSKDEVIQFGRKVEAERLLGIKPKVRPKSLQFISRTYTDRDKLEI
jgi:hypothetical protein